MVSRDYQAVSARILRDCPTPVARYVNKRVSLPLSLVLARLNVSPNAITLFAFLLSFLGFVFLVSASPVIGFLFFQINSILDGCDGEVARLNARQTELGRKLDVYSDYITTFLVYAGFAIGASRLFDSSRPVLVSALALSLVVVTGLLWILMYLGGRLSSNLDDYERQCHARLKNPHDLTGRIAAVFLFMSRRDFYLLMLFILALFHLFAAIPWFLLVVSVSWLGLSAYTLAKNRLA